MGSTRKPGLYRWARHVPTAVCFGVCADDQRKKRLERTVSAIQCEKCDPVAIVFTHSTIKTVVRMAGEVYRQLLRGIHSTVVWSWVCAPPILSAREDY